MPSSFARAGIRPDSCLIASVCSALAPSGRPTGTIWRRTGDSATASISDSHLSGGVSVAIDAFVSSTSFAANSAGNFAVGSGGLDASLRALMILFSSRLSEIDLSHSAKVRSERSFHTALSCSVSSRTLSSLTNESAAVTAARMSLRPAFVTSFNIASALSSQNASLT